MANFLLGEVCVSLSDFEGQVSETIRHFGDRLSLDVVLDGPGGRQFTRDQEGNITTAFPVDSSSGSQNYFASIRKSPNPPNHYSLALWRGIPGNGGTCVIDYENERKLDEFARELDARIV